jgi:glucokinase-like ROK family protein
MRAATHGQPRLSEPEAQIARIVRKAGAISRSELARVTGLSRTAITARLDTLEKVGLIESGGPGPSTGGRPPAVVRYASSRGLVAAIDLGATSIDVAVTSLDADPLAHAAEQIDVRDGPVKVLGRASELLDDLLGGDFGDAGLRGLGIGVPGPVEFSTGRPVSPPIMPGWDQFDVRGYFESRYHCPVFVDNDVNVMALGEGWSGAGSGIADFLFVKLGSGIGCGIVNDWGVYRGANGCAGDIGHVAVGGELAPCHCGNLGCLEAIAGGHALSRSAETLARSGGSDFLQRALQANGALSAVDLGRAVSQGDRTALELVRAAGQAVGSVLAGVVNFYNPPLIIIGGGVANIGDLLLAAIRESVYHRSLPLATRDLVVTRSELGERAGVVGAAAMVLSELYRLAPLGSGQSA